jgi:predicted deacylase
MPGGQLGPNGEQSAVYVKVDLRGALAHVVVAVGYSVNQVVAVIVVRGVVAGVKRLHTTSKPNCIGSYVPQKVCPYTAEAVSALGGVHGPGDPAVEPGDVLGASRVGV